MYQQLWGYKVEDKLYLGVREQKRLNTTALVNVYQSKLHSIYDFFHVYSSKLRNHVAQLFFFLREFELAQRIYILT
jgi:hypothetical protein